MSRIAISNTDIFRNFAGMQCLAGMDYISIEHFGNGLAGGGVDDGEFILRGNYPKGLEIETLNGPYTRLFATVIEDPFEGVFEDIYREIIQTSGPFPDTPLVIPNSDQGTLSFFRRTSVHMVAKTFDFQLKFYRYDEFGKLDELDEDTVSITHDLRIIVGLNYRKGVPVIPIVLRERGLIDK